MSVYRYRHHRKLYFYYRISIDGKQYSRRLEKGKRFSSYDEAKNAEMNFAIKFKKDKITKKDYVYLISSEFLSFLKDKYSSSTIYSFNMIWKNFFLIRLKDLKLIDLNEKIFTAINEDINTLSLVDKHQYVSLGKNFLKFIMKYGIYISEDVFYNSRKKIDFSVKKIKYWTYEQFVQFISVIDDIFWKFLFSILYFYGLRIGELRAIRKENFTKERLIIDSQISNKTLEKGQILLRTKTLSSNRIFPMLDHIYSLYEEYSNVYPADSLYLFPSLSDSLTIGETTIRRKLLYYCKKANLPYIHPHSFRHSCASLLINNGLDYLQVSSWLGHSSPNTTLNTYSHLFESRKNEIFYALNNIVKKTKG